MMATVAILELPAWRADARWVRTAIGDFRAQTPEQAKLIVKAVNMHGRLVKVCEMARHLCRVANGRAYCYACASLPECEIANLLKEARGDNLPGLTAEESALVREHKAEIARGDK